MKEEMKGIVTGFKPTRWIVPEQREMPTNIAINPRVTVEDIDLPLVDDLPLPKLFHVDEIEILDN